MLTIEKTVLPSRQQWLAVIRGMRNPMNSWAKSDTDAAKLEYGVIGEQDRKLMLRLAAEGQPNRKFLRMIPVYADITAPLYWWKEFDTYKIGTVANSCSTMHTIHKREFKMEDFSREHLISDIGSVGWGDFIPSSLMTSIVRALNENRAKYLETKDKVYWWQMIQLLPSSYNQKRTILLNYEVLTQIYRWRRKHKLDEWHTFCEWIETLPYVREFAMGREE